ALYFFSLLPKQASLYNINGGEQKMHRALQIAVPIIIVLAVIGLSHQIVTNPLGLLRTLLFIALFIGGIFLVYRLFMMRRYGTSFIPKKQGPTRKQLQKAKRTSTVQKNGSAKSSFRNSGRQTTNSTITPIKKKTTKSTANRKREHNLTVIEGKKNKKKNRALF
ncbi:SA1362 family protein, partial [Alkalihalobacillus alcalophilus]|nr:SA1362 family protein [Alkalihalobacillus alcalophilus]